MVIEIPLIQPDLRHEEAIIQAFTVLNHLDAVLKDLFGQLEERLDANISRVASLKKRIEKTSNQVKELAKSSKAIRVFSPAQYPAQDASVEVPLTLNLKNHVLNMAYEVESQLDPVDQLVAADKLQFYHIKYTDSAPTTSKTEVVPINCGVPLSDICSVDSLIVFSTTNDLLTTVKRRSTPPKETPRKPQSPPSSLVDKKGSRKVADSIFYTPGNFSAPDLDLPDDLPDLPGVADDVSFRDDASSDRMGSSNLMKEEKVLEVKVEEKEAEGRKEEPQKVESPKMVENTVQIGKHTEEYVIPPPPPPPMATDGPSKAAAGDDKMDEVKKMSEARSTLMEAIRKAGGKAKLRAAAERTNPGDKKKEKPSTSGDLMADLRNKLNMRRKGISGTKEGEATGSVMDKLSALIPPPVPPAPKSDSEAEDEKSDDWEE